MNIAKKKLINRMGIDLDIKRKNGVGRPKGTFKNRIPIHSYKKLQIRLKALREFRRDLMFEVGEDVKTLMRTDQTIEKANKFITKSKKESNKGA